MTGPLPEVFGNVYEGQNAMRDLVRKATHCHLYGVSPHTIATGNMTPSFRESDGKNPSAVFFLRRYFGVRGE